MLGPEHNLDCIPLQRPWKARQGARCLENDGDVAGGEPLENVEIVQGCMGYDLGLNEIELPSWVIL
jgi:hypothetical protein